MGRRTNLQHPEQSYDNYRADPEPPSRPRHRREIGSDVDEQLVNHFNGLYVGELGLKSATGNIGLGLGTSGRVPDGYNDAVRFGVVGPNGYMQASRVAKALEVLAGPTPPATLSAAEQKLPDAEQKRRLARRGRIAAEWPYYYDVLRGYYTRREPGVFEGLLKPYGEFAGVAMLTPLGIEHVLKWRRHQCDEELARASISKIQSSEQHAKHLQDLEEEILRLELIKQVGWKLRIKQLGKQITTARSNTRSPDTDVAVRRRWDAPTEKHAIDALRALARRADGSKDTPDRDQARAIQHGLLEQSRQLWRAAREAYVQARRDNDRDIRAVRRARKTRELEGFGPKLRLIPADQD